MKFVLICLGLLFCESYQIGKNMGPYEIVVKELLNCQEEGGKLAFDIHTYFVKDAGRRKQLYKGEFSLQITREEFYKLTFNNTFYMRKTNDYLLMYKFDGNMCETAFATSKDMYNNFLEKINLEKDECAIPPGNYSVTDWEPKTDLPTPMLEYGSYKVVMQVLLDTKPVACFQILGDVIPSHEGSPRI